MNVLIADDSTMLRDRLKTMISEFPRALVTGEATDAQEVIEKSCQLQPDLIILDFRILGGHGLDVLQKLHNLDPSPTILLLTDFPSPEYRAKCLAAGANYFFDKAFDLEQFRKVLRQLI